MKKTARTTLEFSYKDDDLGDPLINDYFAIAIGAATREEIDKITEYTFKVNDVLESPLKNRSDRLEIEFEDITEILFLQMRFH